MLILITGASGSGKSEYAEKICCGLAGSAKKVLYCNHAALRCRGYNKESAVIMHCDRGKALKR